MAKHALLSASGAHRWLLCTPSAQLEQKFPASTSAYAEEGTVAHALAELTTRYFLGELDEVAYENQIKSEFEPNSYYNFMLNDYITANVQFLDGTNHNMQYSYALYDPTICVSDIVVVKTGHHGFALAKVIEIAPESVTAVQFGREIVSKVDFSAYTARQEKAKQLKELKQKMDAKVKVLQSTALYELLAEKDPELASMLTAYKELTKKEDMNHV